MPKTAEETLEEVHGIVAEYAWSKQPLWQTLMNEKLTRPQIRYFATQYSVFPLHNHNYHGNLYVNCPDPSWRRRIAEVVYEEGTGRLFANDREHSKLWLLFGRALGISDQELWTAPFCAGAMAMRVYFEWICKRQFLEGVAAHMLAGEAQVPGVYGKVARNLQKHFGFTDEDVSFWDVHEIADEDHSQVGRDLLGQFAKNEADYDLVLKTVRDYSGIDALMNEDILRNMKKAA
jgi:pyrroloquinoline-quinone synthase